MSRAAAAAAAAVEPASRPPASGRSKRASGLVLGMLALVAVLVVGLLGASVLPQATLAAGVLSAAGQSRLGSTSQDVVTHLSERLRLAAALLGFFLVGLVVLRADLQDLVDSLRHDLRRPRSLSGVDLLALGVPVLVAVAVRAAFDNQPMRYDEALTFNEFASRPLYYGLSYYPDPNNHLLNTLLMHVAVAGLGNEPWVLRLPALVAGVLLVPATYGLTRVLSGARTAAALAAALVASSSYLVEYSTNGRGYTLQALCFLVLLSRVILAVRHDQPSLLLLGALVAAAGAYAVPTMLYGVGVAAAWFVVAARRARLVRSHPRQPIVCVLVLGLAVTLLYLPVLVVSGADKVMSNRFVVPLTLPELLGQLPASLRSTWALWNRDLTWPVAAILLVGFGAAEVGELRQRRLPLGLLSVTVCLGLALLQRVAPFERVWLFLLPLYLAIASVGLVKLVTIGAARLREGRAGRIPDRLGLAAAALVAAGLAVSTVSSGSINRSDETGAFVDAEAVARALTARLEPEDAVMSTMPASLPELQYYFPRLGLPASTLVRAPEEAQHLYVVTAPPATVIVSGWGRPEQIDQFTQSVLLELGRL